MRPGFKTLLSIGLQLLALLLVTWHHFEPTLDEAMIAILSSFGAVWDWLA